MMRAILLVLVVCIATTMLAQVGPTRGQCRNLDDAFIDRFEYLTQFTAFLVILIPILLAATAQLIGSWWVTAPRSRWLRLAIPLYVVGAAVIIFVPYLAARNLLPENACWYGTPGYLQCLGMTFRDDRRLMWVFSTGGRPAVVSWFAMLLAYTATFALATVVYLGIARMSKSVLGLRAK